MYLYNNTDISIRDFDKYPHLLKYQIYKKGGYNIWVYNKWKTCKMEMAFLNKYFFFWSQEILLLNSVNIFYTFPLFDICNKPYFCIETHNLDTAAFFTDMTVFQSRDLWQLFIYFLVSCGGVLHLIKTKNKIV